jgi:hypothetical protein
LQIARKYYNSDKQFDTLVLTTKDVKSTRLGNIADVFKGLESLLGMTESGEQTRENFGLNNPQSIKNKRAEAGLQRAPATIDVDFFNKIKDVPFIGNSTRIVFGELVAEGESASGAGGLGVEIIGNIGLGASVSAASKVLATLPFVVKLKPVLKSGKTVILNSRPKVTAKLLDNVLVIDSPFAYSLEELYDKARLYKDLAKATDAKNLKFTNIFFGMAAGDEAAIARKKFMDFFRNNGSLRKTGESMFGDIYEAILEL